MTLRPVPLALAAGALVCALAACTPDPAPAPPPPVTPAAVGTTISPPPSLSLPPDAVVALPPTTTAPPAVGPRPANGAVITRRGGGGSGVLKVDNGGASDALVTLAIDGQARREVYVRAGEKTTLSGVADGSYRLFFTSGDAFDRTTRRFLTDPTFEAFPDTAEFATETVRGGTRYTIYECTLQAVANGNTTPTPVGADAYPQ